MRMIQTLPKWDLEVWWYLFDKSRYSISQSCNEVCFWVCAHPLADKVVVSPLSSACRQYVHRNAALVMRSGLNLCGEKVNLYPLLCRRNLAVSDVCHHKATRFYFYMMSFLNHFAKRSLHTRRRVSWKYFKKLLLSFFAQRSLFTGIFLTWSTQRLSCQKLSNIQEERI